MKKYTKIAKSDKDIGDSVKFINVISEFPVKIMVERYVKDRSLAQNRLLHMWLTDINDRAHEVTGKAYGVEAWKIYFKDLFLGYQEITIPLWTSKRDSGFGHCHMEEVKSTKNLTTKEFTDFLEKIDHWAVENLELQLPHPDDLFQEAMGRMK